MHVELLSSIFNIYSCVTTGPVTIHTLRRFAFSLERGSTLYHYHFLLYHFPALYWGLVPARTVSVDLIFICIHCFGVSQVSLIGDLIAPPILSFFHT